MERLELVIVQFEEAKRLIEVGRVPQFRLALIMLDSATELIMHRLAEEELRHERYDFDQLKNLRRLKGWREGKDLLRRRFATGPTDEQLRSEIDRLQERVTSNSRRKKINSNFGDKLDFLIERDRLPGYLAPVLKKLHEYRNETYHRDQHRVEAIRPAVMIYFDVACTVLDHYTLGTMIGVDAQGPELARFQEGIPALRDPFELPHRAARQLRDEVGLDLPAVRTALVDHLLGRLHELESGLAYIEENSVRRASPGDAIRWMQIEDDDLEAIFNIEGALHSRQYPLTMTDVTSWIQRATDMESLTDKHLLFAELASLEDAFEDLERRVLDAVWEIDEAANMR